jgi:hypothetical protein
MEWQKKFNSLLKLPYDQSSAADGCYDTTEALIVMMTIIFLLLTTPSPKKKVEEIEKREKYFYIRKNFLFLKKFLFYFSVI